MNFDQVRRLHKCRLHRCRSDRGKTEVIICPGWANSQNNQRSDCCCPDPRWPSSALQSPNASKLSKSQGIEQLIIWPLILSMCYIFKIIEGRCNTEEGMPLVIDVYSKPCVGGEATAWRRPDITDSASGRIVCGGTSDDISFGVVAVVLHCFIKDILARNTQYMLTMNSLTLVLITVHTNSTVNDLCYNQFAQAPHFDYDQHLMREELCSRSINVVPRSQIHLALI